MELLQGMMWELDGLTGSKESRSCSMIYENASGKSYKKVDRPVPWTVLRLRALRMSRASRVVLAQQR